MRWRLVPSLLMHLGTELQRLVRLLVLFPCTDGCAIGLEALSLTPPKQNLKSFAISIPAYSLTQDEDEGDADKPSPQLHHQARFLIGSDAWCECGAGIHVDVVGVWPTWNDVNPTLLPFGFQAFLHHVLKELQGLDRPLALLACADCCTVAEHAGFQAFRCMPSNSNLHCR